MSIQTTYGYNHDHGYAGDLVFADHEGESVRNAETTQVGFGLFMFKSAFTSATATMAGQGLRFDALLPNATTIDPSLLVVTKRCNLWSIQPNNGLGYNPINQLTDAYNYGYPANYAIEGVTEGTIYIQVSSDVADNAVLTPSTVLYLETAAGANRGKLSITSGASKIALPLAQVRPAESKINVVEGQRHTAVKINIA